MLEVFGKGGNVQASDEIQIVHGLTNVLNNLTKLKLEKNRLTSFEYNLYFHVSDAPSM